MPNFVEIARTVAEIWRFFKMAIVVIFDFRNFKLLAVGTVNSVKLRAKFRGDRLNCSQDIAYRNFCFFFKMAAAAILDFKNLKNINGQTRQEDRTASLCHISSKLLKSQARYGDFSIFQDGGHRHLGFWSRVSNCVTVPNFVEIAQTVADICEFQLGMDGY